MPTLTWQTLNLMSSNSRKLNIPNRSFKRSQRSTQKLHGVEIICWILYADDVLFAKSCQVAEKLLNMIHTTCKRFGLNILFKKTKMQAFNDTSLAENSILIIVDSHVIENVR